MAGADCDINVAVKRVMVCLLAFVWLACFFRVSVALKNAEYNIRHGAPVPTLYLLICALFTSCWFLLFSIMQANDLIIGVDLEITCAFAVGGCSFWFTAGIFFSYCAQEWGVHGKFLQKLFYGII